MRKGILCSLSAALVGAGLAMAQAPSSDAPERPSIPTVPAESEKPAQPAAHKSGKMAAAFHQVVAGCKRKLGVKEKDAAARPSEESKPDQAASSEQATPAAPSSSAEDKAVQPALFAQPTATEAEPEVKNTAEDEKPATLPQSADAAAEPKKGEENKAAPPATSAEASAETKKAADDDKASQPPDRLYFGADYLAWWFKRMELPPLITTGPPAGFGVLGTNGTEVLIGNRNFDDNFRTGGRFNLGVWINDDRTLGVEANYFILGRSTSDLTVPSPGSPLLARPFINTATGAPDAVLIASPGLASGVVTVVDAATRLMGAEANVRARLMNKESIHLSFIGGFRYLQLDDGLVDIDTSLLNIPAPGTFITSTADKFDTRNRFYGGQIGAQAEVCRGPLFADVVAKLAVGANREEVTIQGQTTFFTPVGVPLTIPGSLLAQASNRGTFSRDEFALVPEFGLKVGYQFTSWMRASVGYTFLYASDVVRTADAIDRVVNLSQIPTPLGPSALVGPARPAFSFHNSTDFWAQGVNIGLEFRY